MQQQPGMVNQISTQNVTNVVNNVVQGAAQPIMVFPGVFWPSLGKPCEINNCGAPAYNVCNTNMCGWTGCGKAMCMAHCKIEVQNRKNGGQHMTGYHCVGTPCEIEYQKVQKKILGIVCCVFFCVAFFMFGSVGVTGMNN